VAERLHARTALIAALAAIVAALWLAPRARSAWQPTDFDRERSRLDADIAALRPRASGAPDVATRLAFQLYHRATLTAQPADFAPIETLVDATVREFPTAELRLLRATIDLRFHRLRAARDGLRAIADLERDDDAQLLLADIALQEGAGDEARRRIDLVISRRPTWDARSRLAWLLARQDDVAGADRQYAAAEADLTAKEMRACAWLELQWGQMYFTRGRYEQARAHYARARRAYSGYWLADEYEAELLGAQRDFTRAVARYQEAIAKAPRPDLFQQLGDLYLAMGRPREARGWHDRALAGYLASAEKGEVQFFHHLAAFFADVRQEGAEAVNWARRDLALRPSELTEDALAWALFRSGDVDAALDFSRRAVARDAVDPHVLFHAAAINQAAGRTADARRLTARLEAFNPRYRDFHVHR
jgi:tetratricopeptide (TPR) repeat protein